MQHLFMGVKAGVKSYISGVKAGVKSCISGVKGGVNSCISGVNVCEADDEGVPHILLRF